MAQGPRAPRRRHASALVVARGDCQRRAGRQAPVAMSPPRHARASDHVPPPAADTRSFLHMIFFLASFSFLPSGMIPSAAHVAVPRSFSSLVWPSGGDPAVAVSLTVPPSLGPSSVLCFPPLPVLPGVRRDRGRRVGWDEGRTSSRRLMVKGHGWLCGVSVSGKAVGVAGC